MAKKPAAVCIVKAPAKINLHLKVGEKRPDGFHDIESLFSTIALADTLRFEIAGEKGACHLISKEKFSEDNLVARAVARFRELTGFDAGLRIHLTKCVPIGAGLGGGSSDAASTLLALNALSGMSVPLEKLKETAALLGSDVPFFLTGGTAFVSGRGEFVEPVKSPEGLWVVLVKPHFSVSTAEAFRLLDQLREGAAQEKAAPASGSVNLDAQGLIQALGKGPETWPFYNDFLITGSYATILELLQKKGACFAGLSGSGPCCFGIFKTKILAEQAKMEFFGSRNLIYLTFFLAHRADPVLQYY